MTPNASTITQGNGAAWTRSAVQKVTSRPLGQYVVQSLMPELVPATHPAHHPTINGPVEELDRIRSHRALTPQRSAPQPLQHHIRATIIQPEDQPGDQPADQLWNEDDAAKPRLG